MDKRERGEMGVREQSEGEGRGRKQATKQTSKLTNLCSVDKVGVSLIWCEVVVLHPL